MIDLKSWNPWHGCRKYSEGCAHPAGPPRSGLSHYFGPVRFKLYDPEYGTLLTPEELYHPRYNLHRCAECTMAFACAGCGQCGRCKEIYLVDLDEIWTPE